MERQTRHVKGTASRQEMNNYSELSSLVQKKNRQQTFTQKHARLIKKKEFFSVLFSCSFITIVALLILHLRKAQILSSVCVTVILSNLS